MKSLNESICGFSIGDTIMSPKGILVKIISMYTNCDVRVSNTSTLETQTYTKNYLKQCILWPTIK